MATTDPVYSLDEQSATLTPPAQTTATPQSWDIQATNTQIPSITAPTITGTNKSVNMLPSTGDEPYLVEKRLQDLLDTDNPYITQGETSALKYANSRGLMNSSIAAGAGEDARIKSGLNIATQDANLLGQSALQSQANKELKNRMTLEAKLNEKLMRSQSRLDLKKEGRIEFSSTLGTLSQQFMAEYTNISTSPELTTDQKTTRLKVLKSNYQNMLKIQASLFDYDLDFSAFDSPTPTPDTNDEEEENDQSILDGVEGLISDTPWLKR